MLHDVCIKSCYQKSTFCKMGKDAHDNYTSDFQEVAKMLQVIAKKLMKCKNAKRTGVMLRESLISIHYCLMCITKPSPNESVYYFLLGSEIFLHFLSHVEYRAISTTKREYYSYCPAPVFVESGSGRAVVYHI